MLVNNKQCMRLLTCRRPRTHDKRLRLLHASLRRHVRRWHGPWSWLHSRGWPLGRLCRLSGWQGAPRVQWHRGSYAKSLAWHSLAWTSLALHRTETCGQGSCLWRLPPGSDTGDPVEVGLGMAGMDRPACSTDAFQELPGQTLFFCSARVLEDHLNRAGLEMAGGQTGSSRCSEPSPAGGATEPGGRCNRGPLC